MCHVGRATTTATEQTTLLRLTREDLTHIVETGDKGKALQRALESVPNKEIKRHESVRKSKVVPSKQSQSEPLIS